MIFISGSYKKSLEVNWDAFLFYAHLDCLVMAHPYYFWWWNRCKIIPGQQRIPQGQLCWKWKSMAHFKWLPTRINWVKAKKVTTTFILTIIIFWRCSLVRPIVHWISFPFVPLEGWTWYHVVTVRTINISLSYFFVFHNFYANSKFLQIQSEEFSTTCVCNTPLAIE